jgi:hypothetical protein
VILRVFDHGDHDLILRDEFHHDFILHVVITSFDSSFKNLRLILVY